MLYILILIYSRINKAKIYTKNPLFKKSKFPIIAFKFFILKKIAKLKIQKYQKFEIIFLLKIIIQLIKKIIFFEDFYNLN